MTIVPTLLDQLIIAAHGGSKGAFAAKHGLKPQYIGQVVNGRGQSTMSFARLNQLANSDGYAIGAVLHLHTCDMTTDALANVRAAAIEARHVLEYQKPLTKRRGEQISLLDAIIETL